MEDVALVKKVLRKEILSLRSKLTQKEIDEKSAAIMASLFELPQFKRAKVIMSFVAFRGEVDTTDIIKQSLNKGKRVVVPKTIPKSKQLIASEIFDYEHDLVPGNWGILEPSDETLRPVDIHEIDLVVVPGVAFNEEGYRLGYGAGYYDRFLARLDEHTYTVGIAFEFQIRPQIPLEPHDMNVHMLITEKRRIYCEKNHGEREHKEPTSGISLQAYI